MRRTKLDSGPFVGYGVSFSNGEQRSREGGTGLMPLMSVLGIHLRDALFVEEEYRNRR